MPPYPHTAFAFGNPDAYCWLGQLATRVQELPPEGISLNTPHLTHFSGDWVPVLDAIDTHARSRWGAALPIAALPAPVLAVARRAGMFGSESILPTETNVLPCRHYTEADTLSLGLETAHTLRQARFFPKPLHPILENTLCHLAGDVARYVFGNKLGGHVHTGGHAVAGQRQLLLVLAYVGQSVDADSPGFAPVLAELQKFCRRGGGTIAVASGTRLWTIGPRRTPLAPLAHPFPGGVVHFRVDTTVRLG